MKISVENILGSAQKIAGKRHEDEQGGEGRGREVRSDSVNIENRINTRLATIQTELRDLQHSLTRNQIISDGIGRLGEDFARGGAGAVKILDETRFDGTTVLRAFVGDHPDARALDTARDRVDRLMGDDIARLRKLQVEAENMLAAGARDESAIDELMVGIERSISKADTGTLARVSTLNADTVSRLVR